MFPRAALCPPPELGLATADSKVVQFKDGRRRGMSCHLLGQTGFPPAHPPALALAALPSTGQQASPLLSSFSCLSLLSPKLPLFLPSSLPPSHPLSSHSVLTPPPTLSPPHGSNPYSFPMGKPGGRLAPRGGRAVRGGGAGLHRRAALNDKRGY